VANVVGCNVKLVTFLGCRLPFSCVLLFFLHSVVGLLQESNGFHLFFILNLDQFRFGPHVLHLVLQDVYIDLSGTEVVFKLGFDAFVLLLIEL